MHTHVMLITYLLVKDVVSEVSLFLEVLYCIHLNGYVHFQRSWVQFSEN